MTDGVSNAYIEGIKALLDAHLSNLRGELSRLNGHIESVDSVVQRIERDTNVVIAEMRKDIANHEKRLQASEEEIKAIKSRIEIGEDVQLEHWTKQDTINEGAKKRDDRITNLLLGALATFIGLLITTVWNYVINK